MDKNDLERTQNIPSVVIGWPPKLTDETFDSFMDEQLARAFLFCEHVIVINGDADDAVNAESIHHAWGLVKKVYSRQTYDKPFRCVVLYDGNIDEHLVIHMGQFLKDYDDYCHRYARLARER